MTVSVLTSNTYMIKYVDMYPFVCFF